MQHPTRPLVLAAVLAVVPSLSVPAATAAAAATPRPPHSPPTTVIEQEPPAAARADAPEAEAAPRRSEDPEPAHPAAQVVEPQPSGSKEDPGTSDPAPAPAAVIADEIVVSASHVEVERERVGSAVTVIDRADIERRHATTVEELLATVPGVTVSRSGGPGGTTSVFLRGASSSHTLVLVDGVRVNATGSGAFDWADLTTDGIERIEVLRGPQSALYGSEALGGVISIVSRRGGEGSAGALAAEAGGRDRRRLAGRLAGGTGAWGWSVAASRQQTDGISHAPAARGNRERDGWENVTAAASVGRSLGEDGEARLALRWFDAAAGLDDFVFPQGLVDDPNYRQERRGLVASFTVEKELGPRWTQRLRLGVADEEVRTLDPDPEPSFHRSTFLGTTTDAELAADIVVGAGHTLSVGYVFERREGEQVAAFDAEADLHSLYLEDRFDWRGLSLAVGARYDDHAVFGAETTWRGTASWRLGAETRVHGTWGTGFKAPTFVDLYYPFYGNPELAPESSESWDFGLERSWRGGRLVADLTAFAGRYRDLITFDTRTFLAANVAHAEVEGLEAALSWRPGATWGLAGTYTLTDSEDGATGELLPRRPRHLASVTLDLAPAPRWTASATLVAAADRIDSDGRRLADTERLDATVDYAWAPRLGGYLRLDNLFDEEGEEVGGYASPGATAAVGLRLGVR